MSLQIPQHAGYLLIENRSEFVHVEGATAWLYDFLQLLSSLYEADNYFDRIQ